MLFWLNSVAWPVLMRYLILPFSHLVGRLLWLAYRAGWNGVLSIWSLSRIPLSKRPSTCHGFWLLVVFLHGPLKDPTHFHP